MSGQPISTVFGYQKALGYQQILTAALATAQKLTPPAVVPGQPLRAAVIQNNGTVNIRWRDDGTAPTATVGMVLPAGSELDYFGDITLIQFIEVAAGGELDVSYYS